MLSEKKEIRGKKLVIVEDEPFSGRVSRWAEFDKDLQKFVDSDMEYGTIIVPSSEKAETWRAGLRGRIKAKFKDKIKLVSKKDESGHMHLQLQKVKK